MFLKYLSIESDVLGPLSQIYFGFLLGSSSPPITTLLITVPLMGSELDILFCPFYSKLVLLPLSDATPRKY